MNTGRYLRKTLMVSSALAGLGIMADSAVAQTGSGSEVGIAEIIVTAQKREQRLQDVPIAVTAVTQETLQANRIFTVNDLSAVAPGVAVRQTTGGIQTPAFTIRGAQSYGFVAGSDKQVSIYLDGVYIGSPRGSIFDLPDVSRLEVLRGPQGTLFGRNATAGAVSVTTRDPTGVASAQFDASVGNYDSRRIRVSVETPDIGPFSAYFSFVYNYRRGDIENLAADQFWDRSASPSGLGNGKSARWLGTTDTDSYFAALKFEPSDSFKLVYKYDRNEDQGTPEGTAALNTFSDFGNPLVNAVIGAIYAGNDIDLVPSGKRPKTVSNSWAMPREQTVQGHSATATWTASDNITVKNIFAYRRAEVFSASNLDGISALAFPQGALAPYARLASYSLIGTPTGNALGITSPATVESIGVPYFSNALSGLVGQPLVLVGSQAASVAQQWSDEIQANYTSNKLDVTLGALWFHSKDKTGGPQGMRNTYSYRFGTDTIFPGGVIPLGSEGQYTNKTTSLAAYAQLEYKFLPTLTAVAGARITSDRKTGGFVYSVGTQSRAPIVAPKYTKTKPSFLAGLNWTPNTSTLIYGKWSNSFVSGGTTVGIPYEPETASSFELGAKVDFLDHRLRANLALFDVTYKHAQGVGATSTPQSAAYALAIYTELYGAATAAELLNASSSFVIDRGTIKARGFELELTAAPVKGLTLGSGIGYTDTKYKDINPILLAASGGVFDVTDRPKWTVSAYGVYETPPVIGNSTVQFRVDAQYRSKIDFQANPAAYIARGGVDAGLSAPGFTLVNGRLSLRHIGIGTGDAEIALWGKNIFNRKDMLYALDVGYTTAANYVNARSYGVELSMRY